MEEMSNQFSYLLTVENLSSFTRSYLIFLKFEYLRRFDKTDILTPQRHLQLKSWAVRNDQSHFPIRNADHKNKKPPSS